MVAEAVALAVEEVRSFFPPLPQPAKPKLVHMRASHKEKKMD